MKNKERNRITAEILGGAAAFFVMLGVVGMSRIGDVTAALGEVPQIPAFENGMLSALCSCDPDPEDIDTSEAGSHEMKIRYLGLFGKSITVNVKDMMLPEAEIVGITAVQGTELDAADFVKSVSDQSEVVFSAEDLSTAEAGTRTVSVFLTDEGGNRTEYPARLTVVDPDSLPFAEYGSETGPAVEELRAMFGLESLDGSGIGTDCGFYPVYAETENEKYFLAFPVKDTTPPTAEAVKLDIRRGGAGVRAEDFVTAVTDRSETSAAFAAEPDFDLPGEQTVRILVSDSEGNSTEVESTCQVWDIPEVIPVECGIDREILEKRIADYAGASADVPVLEEGFDPAELGTGSYETTLTGAYSRLALTVAVEDTTPPEGRAVRRDTVKGVPIPPEEFVTDIHDDSAVEIAFRDAPDFTKTGEQTLVLTLTDILGNVGEVTSSVVVWDIPDTVTVECGASAEDVRKLLGSDDGSLTEGLDLSSLAPGEHKLDLNGVYGPFSVTIMAEDTAAPTAEPNPADIRLGQTPKAAELVKNIADATDVTCAFAGKPDFGKSGTVPVSVVLTDEGGNSTTVETAVNVWNLPARFTLECGTSREALGKTVAKYPCGTKTLAVPEQLDCSTMLPGTYAAQLTGEYGSIDVSLVFSDTKAPVLRLRDVTVYTGTEVRAEDFVVSCTDNTSAGYAFVTVPDCKTEHSETVSIRAYDGSGNETTESAKLTVRKDDIPPVISGTKTIYALVGETISYRKDVYATDNVDGDVYVSVDASAVNISAEGSYSVIYTATDSAGNTATVTAAVEIGDINQAMVDKLADNVLAGIITDGMTDREKCWAVYTWVQSSITYSTATSYLMGQYVQSAYSGFTTYAGNCYIHFAVSKAMFDRLGIENIMVQRDKPEHPHYWNLVKIDGNWYHFDATNRSVTTFLSTDAEVAYYSNYVNDGYYSFDASLYPATP